MLMLSIWEDIDTYAAAYAYADADADDADAYDAEDADDAVDADADIDAYIVTPSSSTRSHTLRRVPSTLRGSFSPTNLPTFEWGLT